MANKPVTTDVAANAQYGSSRFNSNFSVLEDAIENCLGRGGTSESPNSMEGDLDMDLNNILNASAINTSSLIIGGETFVVGDTVLAEADYAENVAAMVAATWTVGSIVKTKGYYTSGDGGGATYLIVAGNSGDGYGSHNVGTNTAVIQDWGEANVRQYGARGDGITDDTEAFNAATQATLPYTDGGFSNNSDRKRDVLVPSTTKSYLINGTVYVRKGQHLRGRGLGPSRITISASTGGVTFKLGYGLIDGIPTADNGGLPPSISYLATEGGHTDGAVIEATGVAGASINNLFITTASLAINGAGGDIAITNCTIDDGAFGIRLTGSRNSIIACHFFSNGVDLDVRDGSYDWIVSGCTFAYSEFNNIIFNGTTGLVRDILISDCKFLMNAQLTSNVGAIRLQSGNPRLRIQDCVFSNQYSWGVVQATSENVECSVIGCEFNGEKSHDVYTQSTTSKGILIGDGEWLVNNNVFKNLHGILIQVSTTSVSTAGVAIRNNTVFENSSTSPFITVDAIGKPLSVVGNTRLGGTTLLINSDFAYTSTTPLITLSKNRDFWNIDVAGGRKYIAIPTINSSSFLLRVTYNGSVSGSALYRKSAILAIDKGCSYDTAVKDYVTNISITPVPPGSIPGALDIQVELDAVGSGSSLPYTANRYRNVIVSIPDTNTGSLSFELI